ncbi:uncharacterized conserved protein [Hydrogenimonas sp.]|nr:uncharacterized conserved protein [Hydrogenimonas sp.]
MDSEKTIVIVFADPDIDEDDESLKMLFDAYPDSSIVGCSTAGEIFEDELYSGSLVAAVICFDCTEVSVAACDVESYSNDFVLGEALIRKLDGRDDLRAVFVLSDGLAVNGSELTRGINRSIESSDVVVTGALAGDGDRFQATWVIVDRKLKRNHVTAVGFYGDSIYVGYGSQGGWDRFGIDRRVTRSEGNVLYTLDDKPALELYKRYLGEYADELPASGLLFPLQIKGEGEIKKVRTIVGVNEEENSITFAGDIEEGSCVSFMKANFDNLVSGAEQAAMHIDRDDYDGEDALLIAVSCVGRRLVLGQRSEDELEVVRDIFPPSVRMIGFYSYGEISTGTPGRCDLLNQTMTLTWIREKCAQ